MNKKIRNALAYFILIWGFIHVALWLTGISKRSSTAFVYSYDYAADPADKFYPFDGDIIHYDITELFVYAGIPIIAYFLFRYRKG
jgi:hypothetical protein